MKRFLLIYLILTVFKSTYTFGQNKQAVFPNLKKITLKGDAFPIQSIKIKDKSWLSLITRTSISQFIQNHDNNGGLNLEIGTKGSALSKKNAKKINPIEGSYYLKIDKKTISLAANDSVGVFYGLQTLAQLIKNHQITQAEIIDYPTVKYRGVVEGFYGTPWSLNDRISQLKFYGTIKANTYIYGPKDDPYHSSPNWRKPYPDNEAQQIKQLVTVAKENFVDFVWAIHPGQDIKWAKEDQNNVINKFEMMYALGVRSFAVFFDDISGEGTNALKQAGLLNLINEKFVKVKKDVKPLMMCPTEYNKSWANPKPDGYLSILGEKLDPSVQIMWTGDKVVDDIRKTSLKWVQERIKRPALIWWNFPVSDYVRSHLLLGPSYGLENGIDATQMSGILSNPMEHAEASKAAIFGLADYAWNTEAYAPYKAWIAAIKAIIPDAAEAYTLFSDNNADPGKNGHTYRRKESESVKTYFDKLNKALQNKNPDEKDLDFVNSYFEKVSSAASKIEQSSSNSALVNEIKPWVVDFDKLGKIGTIEIQNYKKLSLNNPAEIWEQFISNFNHKPSFETSTDKKKIIPITGSLVLRPFVDTLQMLNNQLFLEKITGEKKNITLQASIGNVTTQVPALKNLKLLQEDQNKIALQPILEIFEMKANDALIIQLNKSLQNAKINISLDNEDLNWVLLEVSKDGKKWVSPNRYDDNKSIESNVEDTDFSFIKFENIGLEPVKTKINKFTIQYQTNPAEEASSMTQDLNIYTAYTLKPNSNLNIAAPDSEKKSVVLLTNSTSDALEIKVQNQAGDWKTITPKTQKNYLHIDGNESIKNLKITSKSTVQIFEIIWK